MAQAGAFPGAMEWYEVTLVSGEVLRVQTDVEQRWFEDAKRRYLSETRFTERTDLADLDRLLTAELMTFRWNQHLAAGVDYEGNPVNDEQLRRNLRDQYDLINKLKASMGLNKAARNAALDSGNFSEYVADLRRKAKEFGLHREKQLRTALVLMNELSTVVGTYDRSDTEERKKIGFASESDILAWVRDHLLPEYRAVDAHFRANTQRLWRRDNL